ncbi:MAG TPA: hypothetical protein VMV52_10835 [Candidatus Nanopelagicaceae bacterium]|nr:hypothetical protein [Candidatus Nanopelagicaceae bacterium]
MKRRALIVTALLAGSVLVVGTSASQAASTKPTPKPSTSKPSIAGGGGQDDAARGAALKAYSDCLAKQGVKLPALDQPGFGPGTKPSGTPSPKPSASSNAKTQKALAACASLRPKRSFDGGTFGAGSTQFAAFVSCMKDHNVTIAAPRAALAKPKASGTTKPTLAPSADGEGGGRGGMLAGLNQKDPKVAAALKICGALLPARN